jgi:hypothetical protein
VLDYNLLLMLFNFIGWGVQSVQGLGWMDYVPREVGRGVMCGVCCSLVGSADLCRQL